MEGDGGFREPPRFDFAFGGLLSGMRDCLSSESEHRLPIRLKELTVKYGVDPRS